MDCEPGTLMRSDALVSTATVDLPRLSYYSTPDGTVHIELQADRNGFFVIAVLAVLLVLLLACLVMAFALVMAVARGDLTLPSLGLPLLVIAGAALLIYQYSRGVLWTLYGIERVSIDSDMVVYAWSDGWKGTVRRYESAKLADLRWEKDSRPGSRRVEPAIQFYYGAETVSVFFGIGKLEATRVIALIEERLGRQVG